MKLLPIHRINKQPKEGGPVEVVDIGPYLPSFIKSNMTRKDKTKFLIQFEDEGWTKKDGLEMRVSDFHKWALKNNMSLYEITDAMTINFRLGTGD